MKKIIALSVCVIFCSTLIYAQELNPEQAAEFNRLKL